ncbi:enoyl-CoA hydratase/isomerase family protein [Sphingomonas sp. RHCKR47]|uniref:enoyl-CoA hydratase/isomerase family protein n=1 Tax=Sphingomonas citricola TaxID=2862498 RepID=UPI001C6700A2|nr:enoyl-CoA hydratase/isomerase family protein [Sphingomonas citricola]MBW6523764.1 enoyl-CoA hydratase/isomerase family protein [Sphingomonas citricola]
MVATGNGDPVIRLTVTGGVARIALDRAAVRNALPVGAWHDLATAAAQVPEDARAVMLASDVPGIFCAGADLADLARLSDDVAARGTFREAMRAGIEAIAALPMPVVAAVEGGCHGAGVALALACDVIVATTDARFAIPPARLGIGYPAPDVARLVARVGRGQAARLLFTAAPVDAGEAQRIGLVDLLGEATEVVAQIAANDAAALRLLKHAITDPASPNHDRLFERSFASARFAKGVATYRKP